MDAEQRRKIFLTNALGISVGVISLLVMFNDFFLAQNELAGYRRLIVSCFLLAIPFLNQKGFHLFSKIILVVVPGFTVFIIPLLIKDFFPGQLLWFHYGTAIMSAFPVLIFHHRKERLLAIGFFSIYFLLTVFIDQLLLSVNPDSYGLEDLMNNFTDYKIPPIFISICFSVIVYWFNSINVRYSSKLHSINLDLQESNEELRSKTEQLDSMNKNLEKLVEERTRIIASKEKQIIQYANLNAHKVRGPLARILGLINLSNHSENVVDLKDLINKMDLSAAELNDIITEMNKTLSESESD